MLTSHKLVISIGGEVSGKESKFSSISSSENYFRHVFPKKKSEKNKSLGLQTLLKISSSKFQRIFVLPVMTEYLGEGACGNAVANYLFLLKTFHPQPQLFKSICGQKL